jgi:hypothetical protein
MQQDAKIQICVRSYLSSEVIQELTTEVGWMLAIGSQSSPGASNWSQQSQYEVSVRRSPPCKDLSREAEERPLLEAVTKHRNWEHKFMFDSDLWSVITSCKIVQ